ncbi:hypothetical protein HHO38_15310 [Parabacteroides distasonis]|uniref:Lipoprotein n=1 Tax=Parabacteroides distasonis TaxID=823 RepID=A0A7L5EJU4_PARDI|nr:hypothetical protein [Parabacteroides distasonis]QJE29589.1 hypothetical protein HHO38_15310 [Parabacteroides distasonis]WRY45692.1 hypothetical protein P8F78_11095 [Parabacteroides distasonis]
MTYQLRKIAFGLLSCLSFISFNACGDDDNDPTPDPTPKPEEVSASVTYEFSCEPDMLLMTDITVSYTDAEGKEVTETIKETKWKKDLSKVKVPFTANLNVVYTKKEGFTSEKDSYKFGDGLAIGYKTSANKSESSSPSSSSLDVPKNRVDQYLDTWITKEKKISKKIE